MLAFAEIGHLALFIALICSICQAGLPAFRLAGRYSHSQFLAISRLLQMLATLLIIFSFLP